MHKFKKHIALFLTLLLLTTMSTSSLRTFAEELNTQSPELLTTLASSATVAVIDAQDDADEVGEDYGDSDDETVLSVTINEICASNDTCLDDGYGNFYDWVELYNASDETVDLTGYGLSKKKNTPYQYTIPDGVTLATGDYLVIYCNKNTTKEIVENDNGSYNLYAPFNIGADGETIYLTDADGEGICAITTPALKTDDTYGRQPDGDGSLTILSPTPCYSNNDATVISYVDMPTFSVESGFYDTAFQLTLDSPTGTTVYYTLDSSDPATSDTAIAYDGAISIYDNTDEPNLWSALENIMIADYSAPDYNVDKGIIVRAVAVDDDGFVSDVVTKSYFVGKDADYYTDMAVISITSPAENFFDDDYGIYVLGNSYYEYMADPDHKEYSSDANTGWPTNYNQEGRDWEREATVQLFEGGDFAYEVDCGIRIQGNFTRSRAQKSFKIYARSEYGDSKFNYNFFDGLCDVNGNPIESFDKLNINSGGNDYDTGKLRDTLTSQLCMDRDVMVADSRPCMVFLDGEFWGMYMLFERLDDDFIEEHYGIDADDVTVVKNGELDSGNEAILDDYKEFFDWMMTADLSDAANYAYACSKMDMQNFMDYIAIETYVCNSDWGSTTNNNWIMWRSNEIDPDNPYADGRWRYGVMDVQWGLNYQPSNSPDTNALEKRLSTSEKWWNFGAVFHHLFDGSEEFRDAFYDNYVEIINETFDVDTFVTLINYYADLCGQATIDTYKRFNRWSGREETKYKQNIQDLIDFAEKRPAYALQYLNEYYCDHESWTDGVCDACGRVCAHGTAVSSEHTLSETDTSLHDYVCAICGEVASEVHTIKLAEEDDVMIEHYYCSKCGAFFLDEDGEEYVAPIRVMKCEHTHFTNGVCDDCGCACDHLCDDATVYLDEEENAQHSYVCTICGETVTTAHNLEYYATDGLMVDYWQCTDCGAYFTSEEATEAVSYADLWIILTGDVDHDGVVTPIDARQVLLYYDYEQLGIEYPLNFDDEIQARLVSEAADVDGNGAINPIDARFILLYYAGEQVGAGMTWDSLIPRRVAGPLSEENIESTLEQLGVV